MSETPAARSVYLLVHAHPDDETLATAAVLVVLRAQGRPGYVLTATRGEQGEVVAGTLDRYPSGTTLTAVREAELAAATAVLGVQGHAYLGQPPARAAGRQPRIYQDSGMRWITPTQAGPSGDAGPQALTSAPPEEVAADIAAYAAAVGATDLVSYDADGGYGHPDHVLLHQATAAAADRLGLRFWVIESEPGEAVEWYDAAAYRSTVAAAHRAYATQFTVDGDTITHVGGQQQPVVVATGLRQVRR